MPILPRGRALGYTMVLPDAGQVRHDPRRAARPAGLHAGRPRSRGARLPRPHHRRGQRHREGHRRGARDGHPVRHDRAARRDQASAWTTASSSWAATSGTSATTPRTVAACDRRGGRAASSSQRPPGGVRDPRREPRCARRAWSRSCSTRRPSTRQQVAGIFADIRKRPERPAWTGSVDRVPIAAAPPPESRRPVAANGRARHGSGRDRPVTAPRRRSGRGQRSGMRSEAGPAGSRPAGPLRAVRCRHHEPPSRCP